MRLTKVTIDGYRSIASPLTIHLDSDVTMSWAPMTTERRISCTHCVT